MKIVLWLDQEGPQMSYQFEIRSPKEEKYFAKPPEKFILRAKALSAAGLGKEEDLAFAMGASNGLIAIVRQNSHLCIQNGGQSSVKVVCRLDGQYVISCCPAPLEMGKYELQVGNLKLELGVLK